MALRERAEEVLPYRRKIAALKEENRMLRAAAGWEPAGDESDEDEGLGMESEGRQFGGPQQG